MKNKLHNVSSYARNIFKAGAVVCLWLAGAILNAQTPVNTYNFDTDGVVSDGTGTVNGTLMGGATVSGGALHLASNGDYVSFSGIDLYLDQYTSVTQEFFFRAAVNSNGQFFWQWTSYFGDDGGADCMMTTLGSWGSKDYLFLLNNADPKINIVDKSWDDGQWHHMVTVKTPTAIKMYRDGVKVGEQAVSDTTIGTLLAYLGKGSDAWAGDPTWMGDIGEYNLYDGEMDAATVATRSAAYLDILNAKLATLTVSDGTLYPAFDPSITSYSVLIPSGVSSIDVGGTTQNAGANITSGTGPVDLTYGDALVDVVVTAADNETTRTYTINFKEDCYVPTYPSGNLVANPSMLGDFSQQTGFDKGWTNFDPKDPNEDACGFSFGSLYIKANCWPNGGVLNYYSDVDIVPNNQYRILAKIKNETASSSDVFNFVLPNSIWDKEDTDTSGNNQFLVGIPTGTGWVQFDQTITAGPNATGKVGFLIMSCDSNDLGTDSDYLYIDQFEIYNMTTLATDDFAIKNAYKLYPNPSNGGDFSIKLDNSKFGSTVNVKVYNILGKMLLNENFDTKSSTVEVNQNLTSGLYFVRLDDVATTRLIVK